jgi:hypothetical protein
MDKIVLNIEALTVDTFTTSGPAESSIDWTGCMSECGEC